MKSAQNVPMRYFTIKKLKDKNLLSLKREFHGTDP